MVETRTTVGEDHIKKVVNDAISSVEKRVEGNIQSLDMKLVGLENAVLSLRSQIEGIQEEALHSKARWDKIESWMQIIAKEKFVFKGESSATKSEPLAILETPKVPLKVVIHDDTPWNGKEKEEDVEPPDLEILEELEEEILTEGVRRLHLNAIDGKSKRNTIIIRGKIKDMWVNILIDTGSTSSFIDPGVVKALSLHYQSIEPFCIKMVNGNIAVGSYLCPDLCWDVQQYEFAFDFKVMNLSGLHVILGVN
ncbi:OLC1v1019159C1 [Oldenlandia corymbosa var. corymbosa]|uniref:OLC1v1019159C1 n=1 Tax=Oldenlandia corymbosa var. corymbosa TaxID=529605 RepID=A0AAV1EDE3_OLDCO|nr:OLC1v1019159C1 [Oldenlandia corymbosa var. corymbosa]